MKGESNMTRKELDQFLQFFGYYWHKAEESSDGKAHSEAVKEMDKAATKIWDAISK